MRNEEAIYFARPFEGVTRQTIRKGARLREGGIKSHIQKNGGVERNKHEGKPKGIYIRKGKRSGKGELTKHRFQKGFIKKCCCFVAGVERICYKKAEKSMAGSQTKEEVRRREPDAALSSIRRPCETKRGD